MADIQFGVKLGWDGSSYIVGIDAAKGKTVELAATARKAGDDVATGMRQAADATRDAAAATQQYSGSTRTMNDLLAAQTRQMSETTAARASSTATIAAQLAAQQKLENELIDFLSVTDKAYRAQLTFNQGTSLLSQSLRAGIISQGEFETRLAALTARYGPAAAGAVATGHGIEGIGISAGFAAREARALVDELAAGRTGQALGTTTNILGRLAMVNPLAIGAAVGIATIAGSMAAMVASAESLNRSLSSTQAMLTATGRAGQVSDQQLRQTVLTLERLSGVSRDAAEKIVAAFARTPQVGAELFGKLTALVADFATATGEEAPKAAEKLAHAFEDPVKGAKALDAELNFLTSDQLLQLDVMKRNGDLLGQQQLLYDALAKRIQGLHREALTPMQKQTEDLKGTWKELSQSVGDSTATRAATNAYTGLLGLMRGYLSVLPDVASWFSRVAAASLPGGPLVGAIVGALANSGGAAAGAPNVATGTVKPAAGTGTDKDLEEMKKRALDLAAAYHTASESQTEMNQTAATLRTTLIKMEQDGQAGTLTYNRLRDALQALAEKSVATLAQRVALMQRQNALEQAGAAAADALAQDQATREERVLDAKFQTQLVSERAYIDQRAAIEARAAQSRLDKINADIKTEEAYRAKVDAAPAKNKGEVEEKAARVAEIDTKLLGLTTQRAIAENALADVQVKRGERVNALDKKEFEYGTAIATQTSQYLRQQQIQLDNARFELSLIGQTDQAQAAARAERQSRLADEEEINRLLKERAALQSTDDPQKFQDIDNAIARIRLNMPVAAAAARQMAGAISEAQANAGILNGAVRGISDALEEGISRLKTNWHSATMYVRDQILENIWKTLYQLTVQKWIINFGALVTTALLGGVAQGAAGQIGTNAAGSLAGNAATSVAGSYLGGASLGGFYAGASSAAAEGAAGAAFVGPSASLASGSVGAGASAYEAAAAFGPYALIAAAVIAAVLYFAGKGGGPKTGGSSFGEYGPDGSFNPLAVPGTDNGRFFTPSDADPALQRLNNATAATYYSTYAALGGKDPQKFRFGVGADNDPQGTAQSRVSGAVYDAKGNLIYQAQDRSMDDKAVPAALQLESDRQVLAALQHSPLNATVLKILQSLDVKTAGDQAIKDAITLAAQFSSILKQGSSDFVKDANDLYNVQQGGARAALHAQGAALIELANNFDGSAAKTQELAAAQNSYRQSLVQLLVQIKQMQSDLHDMFSTTRDKITRAGMSDQELYNYLQGQANQARDQSLNARDPAAAQRYAARANDFLNQAFDLLSPDQQVAARPAFLAAVDTLETSVDQHLTELSQAIASEAAAPFTVVAGKMDAAADKMLAAAGKIDNAANTIANGGNPGGTPGGGDVNIVVTTSTNGGNEAGVG